MIVRKAIIEDAASLVAAEQKTARTPGLLMSRPNELTRAAFEQKIVELGASGRYIVAEKDGKVVGILSWIRWVCWRLPMCSG